MRGLLFPLALMLALGGIGYGAWRTDLARKALVQQRDDAMNRVADIMTTGIQRSLDCKDAGGLSPSCNIAIGRCAGANLRDGSFDILIGDYTTTPTPDASGFINIGNQFCAWRDTKQVVPCPPPVPHDCMGHDTTAPAGAPRRAS